MKDLPKATPWVLIIITLVGIYWYFSPTIDNRDYFGGPCQFPQELTCEKFIIEENTIRVEVRSRFPENISYEGTLNYYDPETQEFVECETSNLPKTHVQGTSEIYACTFNPEIRKSKSWHSRIELHAKYSGGNTYNELYSSNWYAEVQENSGSNVKR